MISLLKRIYTKLFVRVVYIKEVPDLTEESIEASFDGLRENLEKAFKKHGRKPTMCPLMALGDMTEEFLEFAEAVRQGDKKKIENELYDVGIAAIWGIASLKDGYQ